MYVRKILYVNTSLLLSLSCHVNKENLYITKKDNIQNIDCHCHANIWGTLWNNPITLKVNGLFYRNNFQNDALIMKGPSSPINGATIRTFTVDWKHFIIIVTLSCHVNQEDLYESLLLSFRCRYKSCKGPKYSVPRVTWHPNILSR